MAFFNNAESLDRFHKTARRGVALVKLENLLY
jgi:hypothetical protein